MRTDHLSHHDHQGELSHEPALSLLCKQGYNLGIFQAFSGRIFLQAHFYWMKHPPCICVFVFWLHLQQIYISKSASPTLTPLCSQLDYSASGMYIPVN